MDNKRIFFISDLHLDQAPPTDLFTEWGHVVNKNDGVVILGNVATNNKTFWFSQIQKLPGDKVLFCGDLETNRIKWYHKFGFLGVVAFNESKILPCNYGPVLVSHLPASESVARIAGTKYRGLAHKLERIMDLNSCVLNIHGHTQGKGEDRHNMFDVSHRPDVSGPKLLNLAQILALKFS